MSRKIVGVTVGTPISPEKLREKLGLESGGNVDLTGVVKSVNGRTPDENGNVEVPTGEVTDEQFEQAVDEYFAEHPNVGGFSKPLRAAIYNLLMDAVYQSANHENDIAVLAELLTGGSGGGETINYYTISKGLLNVTISNAVTIIAEGSAYSTTLTADEGYELDEVSVTMGGEPVTVTNGVINIESVTGDIVITATAKATVFTVDVDWTDNKTLGSSAQSLDGGIDSNTTAGFACSSAFDVEEGQTVTLSNSNPEWTNVHPGSTWTCVMWYRLKSDGVSYTYIKRETYNTESNRISFVAPTGAVKARVSSSNLIGYKDTAIVTIS